jgi:hypothetical protein
VQTILSNFEKKSNFCSHPNIEGGIRKRGGGSQGRDLFNNSSFCSSFPPFFTLADKCAYLSCNVNTNEIFMQLDGYAIIEQTINLRLLVSKNTKSCDGELFYSYY